MILVCVADHFQKYRKMSFLKQYHIKTSCKRKFKYLLFFFKSARRVCDLLYFNLIKTEIKTLIFFKKLIFTFFNPKIVKQGCGNTMPDLSDLVSFHSGQVENFDLLVLGQVTKFV